MHLISAGIAAAEPGTSEEILVFGTAPFSQISTTRAMQEAQAPLASVMGAADSLPGLNITDGDSFGLDDWSSSITMRGYQLNLGEQQIGLTIDGMPNGDSSYLYGSKANRFIDAANLAGVKVSQGSSDIGSRSLETLGGTLDYRTDTPLYDQRLRVQFSGGSQQTQRLYLRYDTGLWSDQTTRAWISASRNQATDWIDGISDNWQQQLALRFVSGFHQLVVNGYASSDRTHENNYERLSRQQFDKDPLHDGLTAVWTGVPWLDQQYRPGWATLRNNDFAYLKFDYPASEKLALKASVYSHHMSGRGDWLPPYMVDLVDDGAGTSQSELTAGLPRMGGSPIGAILFVDTHGVSLSPRPGCVSTLSYPYGGAGPEFDPDCYPADAVGVQSYRQTHYHRQRNGLTLDASHDSSFANGIVNTLQAGFWYEGSRHDELREWHKITDTRLGFGYVPQPYWVQFHSQLQRNVRNFYVSDSLEYAALTLSLGLRRFDVDMQKSDLLMAGAESTLNSRSQNLLALGSILALPAHGWQLFAGYSQNSKPVTEAVLSVLDPSARNVAAEFAVNRELGLRYQGKGVAASMVLFKSVFDNRIEFFGSALQGQVPDYQLDVAGEFKNVGGLQTRGLELAFASGFYQHWNGYGSYTLTDARYLGSGQGPTLDATLSLTPGNRVVGMPRQMLVLGLERTSAWAHGGLRTKYVGDRFIDPANTSIARGYILTDAYATFTLPAMVAGLKNLQLNVVINNLTNKIYQGGIEGFGAWTGAPRTLVISMTADF